MLRLVTRVARVDLSNGAQPLTTSTLQAAQTRARACLAAVSLASFASVSGDTELVAPDSEHASDADGDASTAPALTPLQACVSMMPRGSGEFLPAPLRPLVDAPDSPLAEMLGDDRNARLDIELLVQLVEGAPGSTSAPDRH